MSRYRSLTTTGIMCAVSLCAVACGQGALQPESAQTIDPRCLEGEDLGRRVAAIRTATGPAPTGDQFRVAPYIQSLSDHAANIVWFSESANPGSVQVREAAVVALSASPRLACELAYHPDERRHSDTHESLPYRHSYQIKNLEPGMTYRVTVQQDGQQAALRVRTPEPTTVRFVVYADSETEPESTGTRVVWPSVDGSNNERRYLVDQTTGYAANLASIARRYPDFVAIAGDLVESGGEQRDWDEFWRHNAGLAASAPIVPALGNHEYFGGPRDFGGYGADAARRALAKYASYFDRPPYYTLEHGPIALIVLDLNNGKPERSSTDTNWFLRDVAPEWQSGSVQRKWLEQALADAQRDKAFTFVMFHAAPYSSGIHGLPPGVDDGENFSSGLPIRELTPLFARFGVDAVFSGHDEMYEHSIVPGEETLPDGRRVRHQVHFFTVGIGGDGLRGSEPGVDNTYRHFSADRDATEEVDAQGTLLGGGKHYGHLVIDVHRAGNGAWEARFEPVYVFPVMRDGVVTAFEDRVYDDTLVISTGESR